MRFLVFFAVLCSPAHAGISLRWAPALDQALPGVTGPAKEVARGLDGEALLGLRVRLNEIQDLSRAKVDDLESLRRLRRGSAASAERWAALERSLTVWTPVIARLEAQGVRIDERLIASKPLEPALSRALEAEAREDDRRANEIVDSTEADAFLRDRAYFLSPDVLDHLARVHDSVSDQVAIVSPEERGLMRDAVADAPPPGFLRRLAARVRALLARALPR